jgi:hypothetical protein
MVAPNPLKKTVAVSRTGKGAIPDESARGLLKRHLRVAETDEITRSGTGRMPKGG